MSNIDNQTNARNFRFSIFLNNLQNSHFDEIIEEALSKNTNEIDKLKSKKIDLDVDFNIIVEQVLLEQKVKVLSEMKIVYAYKIFENSFKYLLENMFSDFNEREGYNWTYLTRFLKSKDIVISEIFLYPEVNQLRLVNNKIKHSELNNMPGIPEFNGQENIEYIHILDFYKRVEKSHIEFFTDLRNRILLSLQDTRIDRIY